MIYEFSFFLNMLIWLLWRKKNFKHEGMHHCAGFCFVYRKVKKKRKKTIIIILVDDPRYSWYFPMPFIEWHLTRSWHLLKSIILLWHNDRLEDNSWFFLSLLKAMSITLSWLHIKLRLVTEIWAQWVPFWSVALLRTQLVF